MNCRPRLSLPFCCKLDPAGRVSQLTAMILPAAEHQAAIAFALFSKRAMSASARSSSGIRAWLVFDKVPNFG